VRVLLVGTTALFVAGVALITLSVTQGGASVALIVIVPVVSGSSATFLVGVSLLVAGFVGLLFAFSGGWEEEQSASSPDAPRASSGGSGGGGGFVLIGPVPIVFGSWRGVSRRVRGVLALVGTLILIAVVLAFVWLLR